MIVAAIIENDSENEILLCKSKVENGQAMWSFPCCESTGNDFQGHNDLIKKCHEYNVEIEIEPSSVYYEQMDNEGSCVIFFATLRSYSSFSNSEEKNYQWIKTDRLFLYNLDKTFSAAFKSLLIEYAQLESIRESIKCVVNSVSSKFYEYFSIVIQEQKEAIDVFIKYNEQIACPFVFRLDFAFESANQIHIINTIHVVRLFDSGDKTDLYILFSSCMAIIQKLFWKENVYVDYLRLFDEVEVNTASIIFSNQKKQYNSEDFKAALETTYVRFIMSVFDFENLIGSFITELDETKYCQNYLVYLCPEDVIYNCQARKELQYYYNSDMGISLLSINNSEYRDDFFNGLTWDIIDGIDGKILCQINTKNGYLSFNFMSNECWDKIKRVLKDMNISKYSFLCQNNTLYMFEGKNIWIFEGDFSEYWVEEEKKKLLDRQNRENLILRFNRDFKWRYPINFGRFEEMMADLYEAVNPSAKVRLVGRPNCPDGGRDILILETERKDEESFHKRLIVGQCKAYKRSINKSDVIDIRDMIDLYEASGFFLFASTTLTANLIDHLVKLKEKFLVDWWTEREIFKKLRLHSNVADRYTDILEITETHAFNENEKEVAQ